MFDFKQLRCFVAVAEELNFSRAASAVNMTQSPFSRQIRLLEQGLGVQLLDRDRRHVQLTRSGRTFLSEARNILRATDRVAVAARQTAEGMRGSIALGFTTTAGISLMPDIVARCRVCLPNVSLLLRELPSEQQAAAVADGVLEIGLLWPPAASALSRTLMMTEPLVAALPPGDARRHKTSLTCRDFHNEALVMHAPDSASYLHDMVKELLESEQSVPRVVQYLPNPHAILSMVANGLGAALVPQSAMHLNFNGVKFRPLEHADQFLVETHAVWDDQNSNPALARVLEVIGSMPRHPLGRNLSANLVAHIAG
jgi:DNA-binding transcriptional LysR family regulator